MEALAPSYFTRLRALSGLANYLEDGASAQSSSEIEKTLLAIRSALNACVRYVDEEFA
jgi:hypothetical protein